MIAKVAAITVIAGGTGVAAEEVVVNGPLAPNGDSGADHPAGGTHGTAGQAPSGTAGETGSGTTGRGHGDRTGGADGKARTHPNAPGLNTPRSGAVGLGEGEGRPVDPGHSEAAPGRTTEQNRGQSGDAPGHTGTEPGKPGPVEKPSKDKSSHAGEPPAIPLAEVPAEALVPTTAPATTLEQPAAETPAE
jgi:hypothetical protein